MSKKAELIKTIKVDDFGVMYKVVYKRYILEAKKETVYKVV